MMENFDIDGGLSQTHAAMLGNQLARWVLSLDCFIMLL